MIIKAHAKINVALNVIGKKDNGYHDLDMVLLPLELHDYIEIDELPNNYGTFVTTDDASLIDSEQNLGYKAYKKMQEYFKFQKNFRIHIRKKIPLSAGLAGGSSDAAAVMKGIMGLLKLKPDKEEIIEIAKSIGADVPFCFFDEPARAQGIGEILEPITVAKKYYVLLVKPQKGCSTKEIFKISGQYPHGTANVLGIIAALAKGNDELLALSIGNDLLAPACSLLPEIEKLIDDMKNFGFKIVSMSGSGSTVFALSTDKKLVEKGQKYYSKKGYYAEVTKTL